jgi:N-acetylneuraminic acid mutarotase
MKVYGWKKVTDHKQAAFYEISSFSIGNNIFFCAGRTSDDHYAKEVWKYDLVENAWTRMADFPGTLINSYYLVSFAIGNKGYLGLGSPNFFKDFWEFDPSQNKWTRRQDFPGNPWFAPCSFVLNGKAYVGIGYSDVSIVTNDFYSYTPETNIWTKVADLPGDKIREATTFVVNNKAYIIGGETRSGKSKKMWQYDDALNTWSAKSDFPGEYTRLMASFALNSTGYCGLAIDNIAHGTGTFWSYNPIENTWKSISIFPGTPRMSILRGTVGNLGYYGFGSESNAFSDLWIYTPFDFIP